MISTLSAYTTLHSTITRRKHDRLLVYCVNVYVYVKNACEWEPHHAAFWDSHHAAFWDSHHAAFWNFYAFSVFESIYYYWFWLSNFICMVGTLLTCPIFKKIKKYEYFTEHWWRVTMSWKLWGDNKYSKEHRFCFGIKLWYFSWQRTRAQTQLRINICTM